MEHIVQFAIGIDDDAIRKRIEDSAVEQIVNRFYEEVENSLQPHFSKTCFTYNRQINDGVRLLARENVEKITNAYKAAIIEETAKVLADRLFKTKAAKELLKGENAP